MYKLKRSKSGEISVYHDKRGAQSWGNILGGLTDTELEFMNNELSKAKNDSEGKKIFHNVMKYFKTERHKARVSRNSKKTESVKEKNKNEDGLFSKVGKLFARVEKKSEDTTDSENSNQTIYEDWKLNEKNKQKIHQLKIYDKFDGVFTGEKLIEEFKEIEAKDKYSFTTGKEGDYFFFQTQKETKRKYGRYIENSLSGKKFLKLLFPNSNIKIKVDSYNGTLQINLNSAEYEESKSGDGIEIEKYYFKEEKDLKNIYENADNLGVIKFLFLYNFGK